MKSGRAVLPLASLALALAGGCATGGKLKRSTEVLAGEVEAAKKSGAVRCAPKEIALAEANLEFARTEMDEGDAARAGQHLRVAEENIKKARELETRCAPVKVVRIEKVDRDEDGLADADDACPALAGRPELRGCPDEDGDGVPDPDDACPKEPGVPEGKGCPLARDGDSDAVADDIDRCPLDSEDRDGFQDEDGCPDADNDNDGIVDRMDGCPNNPGLLDTRGCPVTDRDGDGLADADDACADAPGKPELKGCPDKDGDAVSDLLDRCPEMPGVPPDGCPKRYGLVEVKKDRIYIKQQVHFATSRFRVLPDSFPLLDQVVQALKDYATMRVRIEGHTDNVGGETANLRLSQKRAEAVQQYLVAKGVETARLEAVGMGLTRPVASNKTERGRGQNRRTEFHIISLD